MDASSSSKSRYRKGSEMGKLIICPSCQRHVACGSTACPFCQAELSSDLSPAAPLRRKGRAMPRVARIAAATAVVLQGACGETAVPIYGIAIDASREDAQPNVEPDAEADGGADAGTMDAPIAGDAYGLPPDAGETD